MGCHDMSLIRMAVVVVVCGALGGCAAWDTPSNYPKDWPALSLERDVQGCPDIEGTYEDQSVAVGGSGVDSMTPRSLLALFKRMPASAFTPPRSHPAQPWRAPVSVRGVTLVPSTTVLDVRFEGAVPESPPVHFRRARAALLEIVLDDAYVCDDLPDGPRLRFLAEIDAVAGGAPFLGFGLTRTTVSLYRASDASLIVRWGWRSDGVAVVMPYGRARDAWLRFRRLPAPGGASPTAAPTSVP